jgi:hypothetical protein
MGTSLWKFQQYSELVRLGPQIADALPIIRKRLQGLVVQLMAVVFLSWRQI